MIVYLLLACAWAKIKGYKVKPILKAYSLYPYAMVEMLFLIMQAMIFMHNYSLVQYASYVKNIYLFTLLIPMFVYKLYKPGLFGAALITIGTLSNKFVMAQNGGKMPVFATLSKITGYYSDTAIQSVDNIHVVGSEATKFKILTDYIDVGWSILSIGDVLIHAFAFIMVYYTIKEINKRQGTSPKKEKERLYGSVKDNNI